MVGSSSSCEDCALHKGTSSGGCCIRMGGLFRPCVRKSTAGRRKQGSGGGVSPPSSHKALLLGWAGSLTRHDASKPRAAGAGEGWVSSEVV